VEFLHIYGTFSLSAELMQCIEKCPIGANFLSYHTQNSGVSLMNLMLLIALNLHWGTGDQTEL